MLCPCLPDITNVCQTEKPVAYLLKDLLLKPMKDLMICFMTRGLITTHRDIVDINVLDTDDLLDFDDIA